jgi:group I intron endonuclease
MHPNVQKVSELQLPQYEKYRDEPPGEGRGIVYVAVNIIDGMMYVGKHIHGLTGKSVASTRWKIHQSKHGKGCRRLYNAIQCHGAENFRWFVIEHLPEDLVTEYESYHISEFGLNTLSPMGYNLLDHDSSGMCSDETRALISEKATERFTDERRKEYSVAATERQNDPSFRAKMSNIKMKGREERFQSLLAGCTSATEEAQVRRQFSRLDQMQARHKKDKDTGVERVRRGSEQHVAKIRAARIEKRQKQLDEADPEERIRLEVKFSRLDARNANRKKTWRIAS